MNTIAIIQARMNSRRLPGKVLMDLAGKTILENIVERVSRAKNIDTTVVATSIEDTDDPVALFLQKHGFNCFRGSLNNVLDRFYNCAKMYNPKVIVRLTADNALIDAEIIDEAVDVFMKNDIDYLYYKSSLPIGMCVEVFSYAALEKAHNEATDIECLEHVTPYIRKNTQIFKVLNYGNNLEENHSNLRFTMDTKADYDFVKTIYEHFFSNQFSYKDILSVLDIHPEWININNKVSQNKVYYNGENYKIQ